MTTTATLASFLLARLDEDEAAAHDATPGRWKVVGPGLVEGHGTVVRDEHLKPDDADHIARHDPARVLADVAAKRAIVEQAVGMLEVSRVMGSEDLGAETVLRALASVYADHPDFDEAWR